MKRKLEPEEIALFIAVVGIAICVGSMGIILILMIYALEGLL